MNLIYYRGLNCHLASIINIAALLGVNYRDAFSTLWSETDFTDDLKYDIYTSKRVFSNLEALGARLETLSCISGKELEGFALISEGELFLIGIDTFHIPWGPVYQSFHGPHYFFARKENTELLSCFDPIYNKQDLQMESKAIIPYAFDLSRIHRLEVRPLQLSPSREAEEILRKNPEILERLYTEMLKCKNKDKKNIRPLIKQISAMINNRYLFQRFLHQYPFITGQEGQLFGKDFLSKWEALKNGLYKASIVKNRESVIDELCSMFLNIIDEEIEIANKIIMLESDTNSV